MRASLGINERCLALVSVVELRPCMLSISERVAKLKRALLSFTHACQASASVAELQPRMLSFSERH